MSRVWLRLAIAQLLLAGGCGGWAPERSAAWYWGMDGRDVSISGHDMRVIKMNDGGYDVLRTGGASNYSLAVFRKAGIAAVEQVSGCKVIEAVIPGDQLVVAMQVLVSCE